MTNWTAIRGRYLREAVPTRLGGLAANLGRIKSFAYTGSNPEVVASLMEESKHPSNGRGQIPPSIPARS
jgi:hypothetical protein